MKGFITLLSLVSASAVLVVASSHLQSRSTSDIVQTKRQSMPVAGDPEPGYNDTCYSLNDTISKGRDILYAYNPSALLVSVQALPETYGDSVTPDKLTNVTLTALDYFNGSFIYMTAHHGYNFGMPQTTNTTISYRSLLSILPLPWPIDVDVLTAFSYYSKKKPGTSEPGISEPGTTYGALLQLPAYNIGPYHAPEVIWRFSLGADEACSVPASASVAGKFMSCVA